MNLLENWVQTPAAHALVWTLIHSLWEGALVALLLAAALWVSRGSRVRYAAACLALVCLLAGFGLTFANLMARQPAIATRIGPLRLAPLDLDTTAPAAIGAVRGLADYLPWLAPIWIAGVLLFHLRSVAGWIAARRLRRRGVCSAPDEWQERLAMLAARLRISAPVSLWESCLAEVPLVIGFIRPVILMPVGLLAGLPVAQVEALLLHELAHIRRYDYLVNLLQVFVEGLVFYHPVVWWIAAVIRAERENCCDDLVVATQGDAFQYASALAALEFNRGAAREPALAATGGSLVKRIRRLLAQPETPRSALTPILSAAILTVTCVAVLAAWQTKPAPQPAPLAAPALAPAPAPAPEPAPKPKLLAQAAPVPQAPPGETPYHKWLTQDVAYIITDAERAAFEAQPTDAEREHFIEQFWLRRDPTPSTPVNEFKDEHYRRIAYTNEKFSTNAGLPGWKTDRGRIYITYGPPDEKETHPSGGEYKRPASEGGGMTKTFPFEQWRYRFIEGVGTNVIIEFVDPTLAGEFRMTMDPNEKDSQFNVQGASVKPHTTVQILGSTAVISVSLREFAAMQQLAHVNRAPNSDAGIAIHGTIFTKAGQQVWTFDDTSKGPALNITRSVPLPIGAYQVKLVITDLASGNALPETVDFEVK